MKSLEVIIQPREKDLGGFSVRRILPYATHRMVGPFIFFDHMGPADFPPGEGMTVRPHPHIHLATVTYLFEGAIQHRDSLGSVQRIEPGAINWMTAGHGIVHSERSPEDLVRAHSRLNGIQLWVALPEEHEETAPSFVHHAASSLPEFAESGVRLKLLLGSAFDRTSPVRVHSDMCYLDAHFSRGARLELPAGSRDYAFYVVSGSVRADDQEVPPFAMGVGVSNGALEIEALADSRVMIIGGTPLGKRHMYWNFVSSSKEALERAKADWARGPGATERFPLVPGDEVDFIPLPEEPWNPKGTPL